MVGSRVGNSPTFTRFNSETCALVGTTAFFADRFRVRGSSTPHTI